MESEGFEDFYEERDDGEVGLGAFLDIEHADFDGIAAEAGDGSTGVGPFRFEDVVRVEGVDGALDTVEDAFLVIGGGGDGFGDDAIGDGGDAVAVMLVDVESGIEAG
ncbi:MAG: hypothetical protein RI897_1822 [Verrucomicrobiota bacterium]